MKFVDRIRVYAKAGRGGNGCLSFLREKYRPFGGPDGGDGGNGGDIRFTADAKVGTLLDFAHHPHLRAEEGAHGKGSGKTGRSGSDLLVAVPLGTLIYKDGRLVADLSRSGATVLVARGGRGGRGNLSFKSSRNTAPRIYEKGEPGEEAVLDLELKLIADVGLVGFPNAGKSTFLARVSNARPKIADYPFTTLAPHLGLVKHKGESFVLADIPGLIEGAHEGKGLGQGFLRHVERTRVLVHLIDPAGFSGVSALGGIRKIEEELKSYSRLLAAKPRILAVNKLDLPEAQDVLRKVRSRYRRRKIFGVSAATGEGMSPLLDVLVTELARQGREALTFEPSDQGLVRVEPGFEVRRLGPSRFEVSGSFVERAAAMTDLGLEESVRRLQSAFKKIGVDRALKSAGIRQGDTVVVGPAEMEWSE